MSVAWELYDASNERCNKYAGWHGTATAIAMLAIEDLQYNDPAKAMARLQKFLDDAAVAFPPFDMSKLERAA